MAHPFEKIFEKAIAKSRGDENHVLGEAEKLRELGYAPKEIYAVLTKLKQSLISDADEKIVAEAVEEFSQYIDNFETT
jgi:Holliday junction resolvasome RuvABC DNA-binding subunit